MNLLSTCVDIALYKQRSTAFKIIMKTLVFISFYSFVFYFTSGMPWRLANKKKKEKKKSETHICM